MQCWSCDSPQGYLIGRGQLVVLEPVSDTEFSTPFVHRGQVHWRCLNAAWGCNWMVPADGPETWCASCRLTRGRPDHADPDAVEAWAEAEATKRLLIFQLHELGLPIRARSDGEPNGLAFDLVYAPGASGVTGHRGGVVTIDLTEHDDFRRDKIRRNLAESYRTLLGHFRHEIGHYYWTILVQQAGRVEAFRACFGDERADYAAAMARHYDRLLDGEADEEHISAYAAAHPWEDWAETFAHYLHIRDTLQTAAAFGIRLVGPVASGSAPAMALHELDEQLSADPSSFRTILDVWVPLADALNAVSQSMGDRRLYPFALTRPVMEKLSFVHECVHRLRG